ncbi:MAG: hypothetical protein Q4C22_00795 [Bacillota bacterium]|nr:hypothetical protein [Bacillota bacterium]
MKKFLIILLALILVFSFAACGGEEAPAADGEEAAGGEAVEENGGEEESQGDPIPASGSLLEEFLLTTLDATQHPVYMAFRTEVEGQTIEGFWAMKDGMIYTESQTTEGRVANLDDGENTYIIMHDEKMYMTNTLNEGALEGMGMDAHIIAGEEGAEITVGTEEYNGVTYICEIVADDEGETRFLFEQDSKDWKYIISEEQVTEVVEYGNDVDDSWFTLPADYTQLSF